MFHNRQKEIKKVLNRYGQIEGTRLLTYLYTFTKTSLALMKTNKQAADDFTSSFVKYILEKHGQEYLDKYSGFFHDNLKNMSLQIELSKTGNKYLDDNIAAYICKRNTPSESIAKSINSDEQSKTSVQPIPSKEILGRDKEKHFTCNYDRNESICPYSCDKCKIAIKEKGDTALMQNNPDEAIKLYKKAIFIEPNFVDAWVRLGDAYAIKSEYNNAISSYDKALSIDPVYGEAMYRKAIALSKIDKKSDAMLIINSILELYKSEEVLDFKKELLASGIEDTQYIIENKKAIVALDDYALKLMEKNNLLNEEGQITVINKLYKPEDFTKQLLNYCRRRYASMGNDKVFGECIIKSFYGAICATIFYSKNENIFANTSLFDYLNEHLDLEFTDMHAERLLHTKEGEEKAEYIWGIISPYVKFAQEKFCKISVVNDAALLQTMKNAFDIGMMTAFYYISGKNKKHSLATREEIDKALLKLSESSKSYVNPPPESAMCYSMPDPGIVKIQFKCQNCGKVSFLTVYSGEENLVDKYRKLAEEFSDLGHKAEILCLCGNCAFQYISSHAFPSSNYIIFSFTAKGSDKPVYSLPSTSMYNDFEYKAALSFLKGSYTIEKIAEDTKTNYNSSVYLKHIKTIIGSAKK